MMWRDLILRKGGIGWREVVYALGFDTGHRMDKILDRLEAVERRQKRIEKRLGAVEARQEDDWVEIVP